MQHNHNLFKLLFNVNNPWLKNTHLKYLRAKNVSQFNVWCNIISKEVLCAVHVFEVKVKKFYTKRVIHCVGFKGWFFTKNYAEWLDNGSGYGMSFCCLPRSLYFYVWKIWHESKVADCNRIESNWMSWGDHYQKFELIRCRYI